MIDKSGANGTGIKEVKTVLKCFGRPTKITIVRSKYLNKRIERDHRFSKLRIRSILGFKASHAVSATLEGIAVANMIRKNQFELECDGFAQFAALAG